LFRSSKEWWWWRFSFLMNLFAMKLSSSNSSEDLDLCSIGISLEGFISLSEPENRLVSDFINFNI
jgi:hypothetical protein